VRTGSRGAEMQVMAGKAPAPKGAGLLEVAKTVLSGFLGVRRRADHERSSARITPVQVIVMAVILAALFVATLITVVHIVVR
jgi:hypothetical protein